MKNEDERSSFLYDINTSIFEQNTQAKQTLSSFYIQLHVGWLLFRSSYKKQYSVKPILEPWEIIEL